MEQFLISNLLMARILYWSSKPMDPKLNQASGALVDIWPTCGQDPLLVKQANESKTEPGKWSHSWCMTYLWPGSPADSSKPMDPKMNQARGAILDVWPTCGQDPLLVKQATGSKAEPGKWSHCWCLTYLWSGSPAGQAGQWIPGCGQVNAAPVIGRLLWNFYRVLDRF